MPIYEYSCVDCGANFEELVPVSKTDNPLCPSCGSEHTTRKISLPGSIGSGGNSNCGSSGFS